MVKIATISFSSKEENDLKSQVDYFLKETQGDGRTYKVGPFYEPTNGFIAVDVYVYLEAREVQKHRALESFYNETKKKETTH